MKPKTNKINETLTFGCCNRSRRSFLTDCAKCIGAAGFYSGIIVPSFLTANSCSSKPNMKVRVVFALWDYPVQLRPTWPNLGYNFAPVVEEIMNTLTNGCQGIEFVQSMIDGQENANKVLSEDQAEGTVEGYLVIQMNNWPRVIQTIVESGKPVIYADFLYAGSGGFVSYTAGQLRAKTANFAHLSSSNLAHLVSAVNCFPLAKGTGGLPAFVDGVRKVRQKAVNAVTVDMKCLDDSVDMLSTDDLLKSLKGKKMLTYEAGTANIGQAAKETLGIEISQRPFIELNELWEKADRDEAQEFVKRWKQNATAITGVTDETLEQSARMYLAMKQSLMNHDACAITINCLGGFYGGQIQAYPCLGFHELLNEGLVGACECDTMSTLTQIIMTTCTKGRPGYISDPVMDMATKQIIYAHCVASNKPFGPQGPANPFSIMTHSEDRAGASLRSTLPTGYMTSTMEINPNRKEILFHQAKVVGNSTEDRACRTKLATVPVGDFDKLYTEWDQWGWHRVTYYGDLKEPVFALADKLGWKVVEEA